MRGGETGAQFLDAAVARAGQWFPSTDGLESSGVSGAQQVPGRC